jgi:predicted Zn-dependent protease
MLGENRPVLTFAVAALLGLVLIVGAQALANAAAPPVQQTSQSRIVGQAGFAYLGGVRMMAAGLLWGSLDAQFHQYQSTKQIEDRLDLLPAIRAVQLLNPQLEQPYYFTSYILARRNRMSDALALAQEGIRNNPQSGLLRASYVQLLFVQDKKGNIAKMLEQTRAGMTPTTTYNSIDDEYESLGVFRVAYQLAGDQAMVQQIEGIMAQLKSQTSTGGSTANQSGLLGLINTWANSATTTEPQSTPATATTK